MVNAGLLLLGLMQAGATPPPSPVPLDTVKIKAAAKRDENREEFEARRKSGMGRYITAADLEKRQVNYTSEVFRSLPGVTLTNDTIFQRGIFAESCVPSLYVNGFLLPEGLSLDVVDNMVSPREVLGIEVYSPGTAPPQYQGRGMTGCGSILFWTKNPNDGIRRRRVSKGTVFAALIMAGSFYALSRLFVRR